MTEKEQMTKLLHEANLFADLHCEKTICQKCREKDRELCIESYIAGWLIRHGVTVGKETQK